MGIRLKRSAKPDVSYSPTKLRSLPDAELYLFVEGGLMTAQQRLSEYRTGDFITRGGFLDLLEAEVRSITTGIEEMQSRSA